MAQSNNQYDFDDNSEYFERHKKKQRSEKYFWYALIAACLGLLYFKLDVILNEISSLPIASNQIQPDLQNNNSTSLITEDCSAALPTNGGLVRNSLDNSAYDNRLPILEATNNYGSPVVLLIGNSDFSSYDRTITLHPGLHYAMHIPQGTYSLTLLVGQTWCNFDKGFLDGKRVKVSRPVEVIAGQTNKINVDGIGKNNKGIHVDIVHVAAANSAPPNGNEEIVANGVIELRRQANGGFSINGTVNQIPVNYQIDTGASFTSIPRDIANRAGIYECRPQSFDTANGKVSGCMATAKNIDFGNFHFKGFQVAVMPNMQGVLLGMNILRFMKIENTGDVMKLSTGNAPEASTAINTTPPMPQPIPLESHSPIASMEHETGNAARIEECYRIRKNATEVIEERMRHRYTSQEGEYFRKDLRQIDDNYSTCKSAAQS